MRQPPLGKPHCPDCQGAGWRDAQKPREIGTSDGRTIKYGSVEPCPCRAAPAPVPTAPPPPAIDNQQKAAGDQG